MPSHLRTVDIIAAKRDGHTLTGEQINALISGYAKGDIPDYQAAAWCMAVYLNGMDAQETAFLTHAMIESGEIIDLSSLSGSFVDKHSTGGVGDKISLVLAPIAAACGLKVPMMSGRALGHTGGTLDKLDSIPGYKTALETEHFVRCVGEVGYAMTGQSDSIVPADRKLYALRDVIATVASIPLITGSILSKKFAEGAQSLIMDVKCGSGAFMKTLDDARSLARSLVNTGKNLNRRVIAVLTDMSEPLGHKVGNFLEVEESVDCLRGDGPSDVMEVTLRLSAWMLLASGMVSELQEAEDRCREVISNGLAMKKFRENVTYQYGRLEELDAMLGKTRAKYSRDIPVSQSGYVGNIDALSVGMAAVALGVGRNTATDSVEPLAGIELFKKTGKAIRSGEAVMRLWAEEEGRLDAAQACLENAIHVQANPPQERKSLILEEIAD